MMKITLVELQIVFTMCLNRFLKMYNLKRTCRTDCIYNVFEPFLEDVQFKENLQLMLLFTLNSADAAESTKAEFIEKTLLRASEVSKFGTFLTIFIYTFY